MRLPLLPGTPRPLVFAHRGVSARAPENTLAAFLLARDEGIPGVELDVHLSADGRLVVAHDHFTGRIAPASRGISGSSGGFEIEKTEWEILGRLDVGSWKGPKFASERLILLGDLFGALGDTVYYDIELKSRVGIDYGLEKALAAEITRARLGKSCLVSSFNPVSIARFREYSPKVPVAAIWSRSRELPLYLRYGGGRWIARCDFIKPDRTLVNPLSRGLWSLTGHSTFVAWTVDSPEEARSLIRAGAAGLISNDPAALRL